MTLYYILNELGEPEEADVITWASWFEQNRNMRAVKREYVDDGVMVSTVFLGIDHSFLLGEKPILWETMVFGGKFDQHETRFSTRQEALDGHKRICDAIKAGLNPFETEA
jgi:hypothetical protein